MKNRNFIAPPTCQGIIAIPARPWGMEFEDWVSLRQSMLFEELASVAQIPAIAKIFKQLKRGIPAINIHSTVDIHDNPSSIFLSAGYFMIKDAMLKRAVQN